MKHWFFAAVLFVLGPAAWAQPADTLFNPYRQAANTRGERLYYVPGTGAVETERGVVILKPGLHKMDAEEAVPEIELPRTFFDLIDTAAVARSPTMRFSSSWCTFNNRGQLLYHAFWFDNGADYWVEGRRRIVEGDKMGLVDRRGHRVVPVRDYTFIAPVRNGYAIGCRDCRYTVFDSADTEHGIGYSGSRYEVLDARGRVVHRMQTNDPDRYFDSLALPRHYRNEATVRRLQRRLTALPETAGAAAEMHIAPDSCQYVCYDEPGPGSPWYHFGYEDVAGLGYGPIVQFLISADGKQIHHINRSLDETVPYAFWRKQPDRWTR